MIVNDVYTSQRASVVLWKQRFDENLRMFRVVPKAGGVVALLLGSALASAWATPLVLNGNFDTTTITTNCNTGQTANCAGQMTTSNVADWATSGYNFIYNSADVRNSGNSTGQYGDPISWQTGQTGTNGQVALYNATAPGSYTGAYKTIFSNPAGNANGNIVGADGAFEVGAITQTVTGLQVGGDYAITFWYAGAQQDTYTGITTETWTVSLGSEAFTAPVLTNASGGFTGWYQETMTFEASSTSEVLSFLAVGTPTGEPPFSLLTGVGATEIDEPGTAALLLASFLGMCVVARRHKDKMVRAGVIRAI